MKYTNGWLQYKKISDVNKSGVSLYANAKGRVIENAGKELLLAFQKLYGRIINLNSEKLFPKEMDAAKEKYIFLNLNPTLALCQGGYQIDCREGKTVITASSEVGLLYGAFAFLKVLQLQQVQDYDFFTFHERKEPHSPFRMLNHWDNTDGSIERGYSGKSFFFQEQQLITNERTFVYARLAASVGINAVVINNVNVRGNATRLISEQYYDSLRKLSEVFTAYGIKLFLSINYAAPMDMGGLFSADPADERVQLWWKEKAEEIWRNLPELGGFLVKADSEGRPGPFTYGRTQAEGANMLAQAIKPYGGLVIWRCFVYNCQQDWRDYKTDRAKASFDYFMPLDGSFHDNVILQIKNGPMDFQVREPVSPLFGGLKKTNMMLEVQIAQEYTGQQRHVCYLIPWFQEILKSKTYCKPEQDRIEDIIGGRTYGNSNCGIAAVANTGDDENWTGHDLAAANFYGFGRLAFDHDLTAEEIAIEWIVQTLGSNEKVIGNLLNILMGSWPAYEKYTAPLGIGWMVKPNIHYGPDVDGYEYDRWGTYHRADHSAIGVDRTAAGTGFCSQYNEPLASLYSERSTCPVELLLFFHRLEYQYILPSGKTVLQHIYDTHFEGADEANKFYEAWIKLEDFLESDVYQRVLERLKHQKEHAREWRDVINSYFYRKSGIPDQYERIIY